MEVIAKRQQAGKKRRGASPDDTYKTFDFISGVVHSVAKTTRKGIAIRSGGNSDSVPKRKKGNLIDYTIGASSATKRNVGKTHEKLIEMGAETAAKALDSFFLGPSTLRKINHSPGGTSIIEEITQSTEEPTTQPTIGLASRGLLFKLKPKKEWKARWFIVDHQNQILKCHRITYNAPQVVAVGKMCAKPASQEINGDFIDFDLEPKDSIKISNIRVETSEKLTSAKHNIFAFNVTSGDKIWNLAATTDMSRQAWITFLKDLTNNA